MGKPSSERLRERLTEESLLQAYNSVPGQRQVGTGGWFPRSTTTSKKWSFYPCYNAVSQGVANEWHLSQRLKDNRGGTTGVAFHSTLVPSSMFKEGARVFLLPGKGAPSNSHFVEGVSNNVNQQTDKRNPVHNPEQ
jgi:hypothetical protein